METKLAISNIAWKSDDEKELLSYLHNCHYAGVEIAPTKIFGNNPYSNKKQFKDYYEFVKQNYDLVICSFQSIWYGITRSLANVDNHPYLIDYTKKIIDCASTIKCNNIVFGNPKLRNDCKPDDENVIDFFTIIGKYAEKKETCISIEANPRIYSTNFINTTKEAIDFCKKVDLNGFKINLDLGTVINNGENLSKVLDDIDMINHIHISEPFLNSIEKRDMHKQLKNIDYRKYISIEMKETNIETIKQVIKYVKEIFDDG